jgi:hypothetical protein
LNVNFFIDGGWRTLLRIKNNRNILFGELKALQGSQAYGGITAIQFLFGIFSGRGQADANSRFHDDIVRAFWRSEMDCLPQHYGRGLWCRLSCVHREEADDDE